MDKYLVYFKMNGETNIVTVNGLKAVKDMKKRYILISAYKIGEKIDIDNI